jgi:hypothetical protein
LSAIVLLTQRFVPVVPAHPAPPPKHAVLPTIRLSTILA